MDSSIGRSWQPFSLLPSSYRWSGGVAEAAKLKGSGPINWVSYATAYSPVTRNNTIWDAVPRPATEDEKDQGPPRHHPICGRR